MKLTCVTATWNVIKAGNRDSLIRCVTSVAALKTAHEHLIYDGASTDGTAELLRELEATTPGLKVVSEPDTGIYNALNKGVRDAKGEWFYVLGCDDVLAHPAVMDEIISSTGAETDVIAAIVTRDGKPHFFQDERFLYQLFERTTLCHQGLLFRTADVRKFNGFDPRFKIAGDIVMIMQAYLANLRFKYEYKVFAEFASGGTAQQGGEQSYIEFLHAIRNALGLTDSDIAYFRCKGFHNPRKMLKFVFHRNYVVRRSALRMLWMWAKSVIKTFCPYVTRINHLPLFKKK